MQDAVLRTPANLDRRPAFDDSNPIQIPEELPDLLVRAIDREDRVRLEL